jgi:hypothetical protein
MAQVEWLCRGYSWTKPTLRKHSKCGISATIQERIRDVNIKFTTLLSAEARFCGCIR